MKLIMENWREYLEEERLLQEALLLEQRLDELGDYLSAAPRFLDDEHMAARQQHFVDGSEGARPALDHKQRSRHAQKITDRLLHPATQLDLRAPRGAGPAVDEQEVRVLLVEGGGGVRVLYALDVVHAARTPVRVALRVTEALLVSDLVERGVLESIVGWDKR